MNIGGLKENDFVFVLGFPGGTTRYRESQSIEFARDANFPFLANWLRAELKCYARSERPTRKSASSFRATLLVSTIQERHLTAELFDLDVRMWFRQRQAEEARMATWIAADPMRQKKYGTLLADLKSLSEETNAASKRDVIMRRFPDPISGTVFGAVVNLATAVKHGKKLDDKQKGAIDEKPLKNASLCRNAKCSNST